MNEPDYDEPALFCTFIIKINYMDTQAYIQVNPNIMMGKAVIKGTRITVELVLEKLSEGETVEDLLEAYPHISREAIQAVIGYAAQNLKFDTFYPIAV